MLIPAAWHGSIPARWVYPDGLFYVATETTTSLRSAQMDTILGKLFGSLLGAVIGWKRILDTGYLIVLGIWRGMNPDWFDLLDSPLRNDLGSASTYLH